MDCNSFNIVNNITVTIIFIIVCRFFIYMTIVDVAFAALGGSSMINRIILVIFITFVITALIIAIWWYGISYVCNYNITLAWVLYITTISILVWMYVYKPEVIQRSILGSNCSKISLYFFIFLYIYSIFNKFE